MVERFRKIKQIGKGGFGYVYQAFDLQTGETVALKELTQTFTDWDECLEQTEVKCLQSINHPNIVQLKEVFFQDNKLSLIYELLDTDLNQIIQSKLKNFESFSENQIKNYMY